MLTLDNIYLYLCVGFISQGHSEGLVMGSFWTGQRTDPAGCCAVHREWALTGWVPSQWLGTTQLWPHGGCWSVLQPLYRLECTHAQTHTHTHTHWHRNTRSLIHCLTQLHCLLQLCILNIIVVIRFMCWLCRYTVTEWSSSVAMQTLSTTLYL